MDQVAHSGDHVMISLPAQDREYAYNCLQEFFTLYEVDRATPETHHQVVDRCWALIQEEVEESCEAQRKLAYCDCDQTADRLADFAKELADVLYVCEYARYALNLPMIHEAISWDVLHRGELADQVERSFKILKAVPDTRNMLAAAYDINALENEVYYAACVRNIPLMSVFGEVHRSNLDKVWEDGTVHRDERGKVIKPPTWQPPDIRSLVERHLESLPFNPYHIP